MSDIRKIPTGWLRCRWANRHAFDDGRLSMESRYLGTWVAVCGRCGTESQIDYRVKRTGAGVSEITRLTTTPRYEWTLEYKTAMRLVTPAEAGQEILRRMLEGDPTEGEAA